MQAAENAMSWSAAMRTLPKYLLTLTIGSLDSVVPLPWGQLPKQKFRCQND